MNSDRKLRCCTQLYWTVLTWIPLFSTMLTMCPCSPRWLLWGESLPQWGNVCDGSRRGSIYLHLRRWLRRRHLQPDGDGFVLAEGDSFFFHLCHSCCLLNSSLLFSQDPAARTPARTTACVRLWRWPDEGMFLMSTSASVGQASRGCTARPVSSHWKSCLCVCLVFKPVCEEILDKDCGGSVSSVNIGFGFIMK